jgi:phospholipid/cholesterol/gamma-HCH transport system ATP-binding protein
MTADDCIVNRAASDGTGEAPVEIRAEGLCKAFGDQSVLSSVDITIRRGEIVAVVGASGSGKTVLLEILTGLMMPDSGRVLAADHARAGAPLVDLGEVEDEVVDEIRLSWALVFQRNALFSGSVRDNVALWLREHTSLRERQIEQRIRQSLKAAALDVDGVIDKDREMLSGGMAKRVAIARALAVDPLVIFYDEPTTGLDPVVGGHIHQLIFETHGRPIGDIAPERLETGGRNMTRTTVIVTHDRELLRRLTPRVVMLFEGGVCFDGPYEDFRAGPCAAARTYLEAMPVLQTKPVRG